MAFRLLAILAFLSFPFPVFPAEVAGVKLPDEDQKLLLNGAGLRRRAFFQVYVIGLYLPQKAAAAADAIGAAGPKRVAIHMLRNVDAATFTGALEDGMRDNHDDAQMKALEARMKQLAATMAEIKEAKQGMRITLDWVPGTGTQLTVEGRPSGAPIPGEDFYRGLLRIWLGENPVQADLKKALLGGS
ncbi:MAG: chalcone isomerase family protein [Pseudomonadota bacterium]